MATAHNKTSPRQGRVVVFPTKRREDSPRAVKRFDPRALKARRLRVIGYFARLTIHFIWWDYFLKRSWLSGFRTPWVPRWQRLTESYKELALDVQGLWIKLGQYLSTRVDVLPLEITTVLASLRDEVPAESIAAITAQIEADFGYPVAEIFASFSPWPVGSASLAQVHRARTLAGDSVVVKVLRPGIREMIDADIKLLRQLAYWLKWIKPISRRANIDAIVNEFDKVTRNELDLRLEARNAETFADDFANDPGIAAPRIYHNQSSLSTLTMEDVSYIRIDDLAALDDAGISRSAVASTVYNAYLRQFFVTYRVHVDPHPGNLFVRPLRTAAEMAAYPNGFGPGDPVPYAIDRPFQVLIVDFGMFVELPQRLREGLREFAIGLGTRDARRVLDAYAKVGVLQPGGDLYQLEEMIQAQLDDLWGTFLGQVRASDLTSEAARAFFAKYEELLSVTPLQFQTEMLFVVRAMGILSGITSNLEPDFDPWTETANFAQALIQEDLLRTMYSVMQDLAAGRVPLTLAPMLSGLSRPHSVPPVAQVFDASRAEDIRVLRRRVNRLTTAVAACGMIVVGAVLKTRGVRVSDAVALLWPGRDLGQWVIEIAAVTLLIILLRGGSSR